MQHHYQQQSTPPPEDPTIHADHLAHALEKIPAHCLQWRSPQMSGVAFWYFDTRAQAEHARDGLQPGSTAKIVYIWLDASAWKVVRHA